jgi:hypothetical protein
MTPAPGTTPSPTGIISGQVTDTNTGKPIVDASVTATGDSEGYGSDTTDQNGKYTISTGLTAGTYTVTASQEGYQDQSKTGVSVSINQVTANVNFQLTPLPAQQSGTITGTVTGAANPIPEISTPMLAVMSIAIASVAVTRLVHKRLSKKT